MDPIAEEQNYVPVGFAAYTRQWDEAARIVAAYLRAVRPGVDFLSLNLDLPDFAPDPLDDSFFEVPEAVDLPVGARLASPALPNSTLVANPQALPVPGPLSVEGEVPAGSARTRRQHVACDTRETASEPGEGEISPPPTSLPPSHSSPPLHFTPSHLAPSSHPLHPSTIPLSELIAQLTQCPNHLFAHEDLKNQVPAWRVFYLAIHILKTAQDYRTRSMAEENRESSANDGNSQTADDYARKAQSDLDALQNDPDPEGGVEEALAL